MCAYIFDFDGTLGDSMPFFAKGMIEILNENGINVSEDIIKTITPLGYQGTAKYFIEEFKLAYTKESLVDAMYEKMYPAYQDEIVLKCGVQEYLTELRKVGHSLNVLSASPFRMISAVLKRCGVFELFDNVWSCEDFNMTKSETEIYYAAVTKVGTDIKNTIFFDDNIIAIKTAVKAGIYTVGVYDNTNKDYIEDIIKVADKFIYSFEELRAEMRHEIS